MALIRGMVLGLSLAMPFVVRAATWTGADGVRLEYKVSGDGATITGCWLPYNFQGGLEIPAELGSCPVRSIKSWAFSGCSGLTSVTIPVSVTAIDGDAFEDCSGLMSFTVAADNPNYKSVNRLLLSKDGRTLVSGVNGRVTIPEGVTVIGDFAFFHRSGLTSVTIPASVTGIGWGAFSDCSGLTSFAVAADNPNYKSVNRLLLSKDGRTLVSGVNGRVTIPEGVTEIGAYAFYGYSGLTSVTIPASVTEIGYLAFWGCGGLTAVVIPNSVTSIEWGAFLGCGSLKSLTIPDSVTAIEGAAFYCCFGLTSVTMAEGVTVIGDDTFVGCTSLKSVTIPASVASIGSCAFHRCAELTSFTVAADNPNYKSVNGHLLTKDGRTLLRGVNGVNGRVTIPEGVTVIGDSAFYGCSGLKSVTIPEGVTAIAGAFYGCSSLTSVTIPASVTEIGDRAFEGCCSLTSVTIPASVTAMANGAF